MRRASNPTSASPRSVGGARALPAVLILITPGRALRWAPRWACAEDAVLFDASSGDYWVLSAEGRAVIEWLQAENRIDHDALLDRLAPVTTEGKVKAKGLYAEAGVLENKNPTMEVCSLAVKDYLLHDTLPENFIRQHKIMKDFLAIRGVSGGGIQHEKFVEVDDWESCEGGWTHPGRTSKPLKRKSRPASRLVGVGGKPFGRVARWYMSTKSQPPLTYVGSGNQVPKTEGAQICMTLPKTMPKDLDLACYVQETYSMMHDLGIDHGSR